MSGAVEPLPTFPECDSSAYPVPAQHSTHTAAQHPAPAARVIPDYLHTVPPLCSLPSVQGAADPPQVCCRSEGTRSPDCSVFSGLAPGWWWLVVVGMSPVCHSPSHILHWTRRQQQQPGWGTTTLTRHLLNISPRLTSPSHPEKQSTKFHDGESTWNWDSPC